MHLVLLMAALPAFLPVTCQPGDFVDSYDLPWRCTSADNWEKAPPGVWSWHLPAPLEIGFGCGSGGLGTTCEYISGKQHVIACDDYTGKPEPCSHPDAPNCSWAFKDSDGVWHCPLETASGRVVGCAPYQDILDKEYVKWLARCKDIVRLMKVADTVEPSSVESSERTDHTFAGGFTCPTGYDLHWFGPKRENPICYRVRARSHDVWTPKL